MTSCRADRILFAPLIIANCVDIVAVGQCLTAVPGTSACHCLQESGILRGMETARRAGRGVFVAADVHHLASGGARVAAWWLPMLASRTWWPTVSNAWSGQGAGRRGRPRRRPWRRRRPRPDQQRRGRVRAAADRDHLGAGECGEVDLEPAHGLATVTRTRRPARRP